MSRRKRRVATVTIIALLGALLVAPATAWAAGGGTVTATVTAEAPCLLVSGSYDFGTVAFSQANSASFGQIGVGASAENCASTNEVLLARGSSAQNGSTIWALRPEDNPCNYGLNSYQLRLADGASAYVLSLNDQATWTITGGSTKYIDGRIAMPCTGSDGAGVQLSSTITLTATF